MGKYTILSTLAVALSLTVLSTQGMETDQDTSEGQAERQKTVLARQIAASAFEMGMRRWGLRTFRCPSPAAAGCPAS